MSELMDFIMNNYVIILVIIILILLAIIGSYADKTNFGQGKKSIAEEDENQKKGSNINANVASMYSNQKDINSNGVTANAVNSTVNSSANNYASVVDNYDGNANSTVSSVDSSIEFANNSNGTNNVASNSMPEQNLVDHSSETNELSVNASDTMNSLEEKLNNLDIEIKSALPEKEIINTEILDDISELSFDFSEKINSSNEYDNNDSLNDLELPTIKSLKTNLDDVWKK